MPKEPEATKENHQLQAMKLTVLQHDIAYLEGGSIFELSIPFFYIVNFVLLLTQVRFILSFYQEEWI